METPYSQLENESTADWLRRFVNIDAPEYKVNAVREILASERGKSLLTVSI
jgi:hypothetical protein